MGKGGGMNRNQYVDIINSSRRSRYKIGGIDIQPLGNM
jgi:hypothetical protein